MMDEKNEIVITTYGELPKSCKECIFSSFGQRFCIITHREKPKFEYKDERCIYCKVLPKKHGRLIDADEVKKLMQSGFSLDTYEDKAYVCSLIDEIPTIIEAST